MRLHLVSLPHTQVSPQFCGCAYTSKVLKFCRMMGKAHEIELYAPEGRSVPGTNLHTCLTNRERNSIFGADDPSRLPGWPTHEQMELFNARAVEQLKRHSVQHDLILLSGGLSHKAIAAALPDRLFCEPFCGYEGILTDKVAFESQTHRHTVYALQKIIDGRWFDEVIPNFFDLADFPYRNRGNGDYLLYLGRIIPRKGINVAIELAKHARMPLVVAGPGGEHLKGEGVEYVGPVGVERRATLMAGARALVCPTLYIEPFGGVAVEAMMCGTPVIATNWGAFTETVINGRTGFRFNSLAEGVQAVDRCQSLQSDIIREHAINRYSFDAVEPQFSRWFDRLQTLWGQGWYE